MSFQAFINSPKSYLATHEMQLQGGGAVLVPPQITRGVPVVNPAGGQSVQYTHVATHQLTQTLPAAPATNWRASLARRLRLSPRRQLTYTAAAGGPAPAFRLLPWEATNVSFMELAAGANFAVTGPLTGCTIGVVRHPGTGNVWFFHANVAGGGGALHLVTKRLMIRNAGFLVGIPVASNYQWCEMGIGNQYQGLAFVWGRLRAGGLWKFYVHDINLPVAPGGANQVANARWALL